MKLNKTVLAGSVLAATALSSVGRAQSQQQTVKNIVLVHGAFADGTSWAKVIPILESRGFHVVAVQNPLTSLADDVNATRRIIALQDGPVILVGHSWGELLSPKLVMIPRSPGSSTLRHTFPTRVHQRTTLAPLSAQRQGRALYRSTLTTSLPCRERVFSTALQKVCRWPNGGWFSRYKARSTAQCSMRS